MGNVSSNLPFILIALHAIASQREAPMAWTVFHCGILLIGFGSAYYHRNPNNATLIWDRLPMTIGFMSFLFIFLDARYDLSIFWLFVFLAFGMSSVAYWAKYDDLIPYALVQFGPLIAIPWIMLCGAMDGDSDVWRGFICYALAKGFEVGDKMVFVLTRRTISGHTIKHL